MIQLHPNGPRQPHVHVLGDFAGQAAQMLADAIVKTVHNKGRCRLGLPGGTAAGAVFGQLREVLPAHIYPQLFITWTDEPVLEHVGRAPGDWQPFDPESNLRLAYAEWLSKVAIAPENLLPLSLSGDAKVELVRFGRAFHAQFDGGLDIAVVELGEDGHVAALFPDHPALDVDDTALVVHDCPQPPTVRISLTTRVLKRAETLVILARGKEKASVVARVLRGAPELPASRFIDHPQLYVLLDGPAATGVVAAAMDKLTATD